MSDPQKQELIWVQGQLSNLIDEARYCGAKDAERILSSFAHVVAIAINAHS